ncbi:MAG: protein-export chaperone SecB [Alphaproteobacteria bacterium]|nr:protein-export chaperone SecB [Alphaproteobacteria bacterium]
MSGKKVNGTSTKQPRFQCLGQAVRDLSFECPVPAFLVENVPSDMDLNLSVSVSGREQPESTWDVTLALRAESKLEGRSLFLIELAYGGVFLVENLEDDQRDAVLHVDAAAMLYPFARQLLMSTVVEGGYRPPLLDAVNFGAIYQQSMLQKQAAESKEEQQEKNAK